MMSISPHAKLIHERSRSCCRSAFGYLPVTHPPRSKPKIPRNPSLSPVTNYGLEQLSLGDVPESVSSSRQVIRCGEGKSRRKESISKGSEAGEHGSREEGKILEVVLLDSASNKLANGALPASSSPEGFIVHRYSLPRRLIPIKKSIHYSDREESSSLEPYYAEEEEGYQNSLPKLQGRMGGWMLTRVKVGQIQSNKPVLRRKVYRKKRKNSQEEVTEQLYLKYLRLKQITNQTPS